MKTALKTLSLLLLVTSALADDAAIKKQLVGKWRYSPELGGEVVTLNGDGKMDSIRTWDVQNGKFFIIKKSGSTEPFTILKLTKTHFTFQDDYRAHGIATWTRVQ
jgi:hypothetical protein